MSLRLGSSLFPPRERPMQKEKAVQLSRDYIPHNPGLSYSLGQAMAQVAEMFHFHAELTEQRRRLEQTNQELHRRNAELQSFYHVLSHELKTPLTVIMGYLAIVLDGLAGSLTEQQQQYLSIAKVSCDQIALALNDLLDATRLETGKLAIVPHPVAIDAVVSQVVAAMLPIAQEKGIQLRHVSAQTSPTPSSTRSGSSRCSQIC